MLTPRTITSTFEKDKEKDKITFNPWKKMKPNTEKRLDKNDNLFWQESRKKKKKHTIPRQTIFNTKNMKKIKPFMKNNKHRK